MCVTPEFIHGEKVSKSTGRLCRILIELSLTLSPSSIRKTIAMCKPIIYARLRYLHVISTFFRNMFCGAILGGDYVKPGCFQASERTKNIKPDGGLMFFMRIILLFITILPEYTFLLHSCLYQSVRHRLQARFEKC